MMLDTDLAPYVALADNARRAEALQERELEAIAHVVDTIRPFLESGYAMQKWRAVPESIYCTRSERRLLRHTYYQKEHCYLYLRSDGVLYVQSQRPSRFCAAGLHFEPWEPAFAKYSAAGVRDYTPKLVLRLLVNWRREIMEHAESLQADLLKREELLRQAFV